MRLLLFLLLFILVTDCRCRAEEGSKPSVQADEAVVEVAGAILTVAEADAQVEKSLILYRHNVSPERLAALREELLDEVVERFIGQTLIDREIARLDPAISAADEEEMYAEMRASLPPGVKLDDVLKSAPESAAAVHSQVVMMCKLDKILADRVKITDSDIAQFVQGNKDRLTLPESVHARHILIAVSNDDSAEVRREKKRKADLIHAELLRGADFAATASKHSDCPSRQTGGDLGVFPMEGPGAPAHTAFKTAAFSQKPGEIGPVVETSMGYHILQVIKHMRQEPLPREQIVRLLKSEKRQQAKASMIRELREDAKVVRHR